MDTLSYKTISINKETAKKEWLLTLPTRWWDALLRK